MCGWVGGRAPEGFLFVGGLGSLLCVCVRARMRTCCTRVCVRACGCVRARGRARVRASVRAVAAAEDGCVGMLRVVVVVVMVMDGL